MPLTAQPWRYGPLVVHCFSTLPMCEGGANFASLVASGEHCLPNEPFGPQRNEEDSVPEYSLPLGRGELGGWGGGVQEEGEQSTLSLPQAVKITTSIVTS